MSDADADARTPCDLCRTPTPAALLQPEAFQEWDALCPACFLIATRQTAHEQQTVEDATRRRHLAHLAADLRAMADALEAAEAMPGGGTLQAVADTAWNACVALALGIQDWIDSQQDDA